MYKAERNNNNNTLNDQIKFCKTSDVKGEIKIPFTKKGMTKF